MCQRCCAAFPRNGWWLHALAVVDSPRRVGNGESLAAARPVRLPAPQGASTSSRNGCTVRPGRGDGGKIEAVLLGRFPRTVRPGPPLRGPVEAHLWRAAAATQAPGRIRWGAVVMICDRLPLQVEAPPRSRQEVQRRGRPGPSLSGEPGRKASPAHSPRCPVRLSVSSSRPRRRDRVSAFGDLPLDDRRLGHRHSSFGIAT